MVPWVLMFGLSALTFNHRGWFFPPRNAKAPESREIFRTQQTFWNPDSIQAQDAPKTMASSLLAEINSQGGKWTLSPQPLPSLSPSPVVTNGVLSPKTELRFGASFGGKQWSVRATASTGTVIATAAPAGRGFIETAAGFIGFLHKSSASQKGNAPATSIRKWWLVVADGMAFLLIFWGISGLLMWWQMKGQRLWGAVTLAACLVTTILIMTGMWKASGGGQGREGKEGRGEGRGPRNGGEGNAEFSRGERD